MRVSRRKDTGKWGYRHYYHGKNYRKHEWDTREDAVEALNELVDKLKREVPIIDSNIAIVEAVNEFMKYSKRVAKSDWRLKALYSNFKSFVLPFFGPERRLKTITHLDIDTFIDEQMKRAISKNTINHYITDLNALLNWALREELIFANPMKRVNCKRIKPEKLVKVGHSPEQIRVCESVLKGEELLFFKVLKYTGARLTEALSLTWADVDYNKFELFIRGTKTEGSFRKIDMSEGLFRTLKELENYRDDTSPHIFHHADGSRIKRRTKVFKKIGDLTGIRIRAKDLRDYFASSIAMGTDDYRPDIVTVSELLGHTNLNTTKKYLFSLKDRRMRAVSVLDELDRISTEISTGGGIDEGGTGVSARKDWWRCRDLNPGHCGYEPHALTN